MEEYKFNLKKTLIRVMENKIGTPGNLPPIRLFGLHRVRVSDSTGPRARDSEGKRVDFYLGDGYDTLSRTPTTVITVSVGEQGLQCEFPRPSELLGRFTVDMVGPRVALRSRLFRYPRPSRLLQWTRRLFPVPVKRGDPPSVVLDYYFESWRSIRDL